MALRILGGIFLSSIEPLNDNVNFKEQHNITHILSVLPGPIPHDYAKDYVHKQIEVYDEPTANIIDFFPETNKIIESALFPAGSTAEKHRGCILIHCSQGVSRSVTVIMAYLMQKYKLSQEQARHAVQRKSSDACPNSGFEKQLDLYAKLKFNVDSSSSLYKQVFIDLYLENNRPLQQANMFPSESPLLAEIKAEKQAELRCQRCRQVLALDAQIESHTPPDPSSRQSQFIKTAPNSRRIISAQDASSVCSHYFVKEPLEWMKGELEGKQEIDGRFCCPKCSSKVGGYSWKGSRCSCGKWMIPALHLQAARVDRIKPLTL